MNSTRVDAKVPSPLEGEGQGEGAASPKSSPPEPQDDFSSVGPSYAVTAASEEHGFQLAPAAIRRLGIAWEALSRPADDAVPDSALVYFQAEIGVYRLRDGWFRLVPVKIRQKNQGTVRIETDELKSGDAIAVRGAAFLRVADMQLFGEHGGGHAH